MKKILSLILLIFMVLLLGCCAPATEPAGVPEVEGTQTPEPEFSPLLKPEPSKAQTLTVLMYHHFEEQGNGFSVVSRERFREQLTALKQDGYQSITLEQLLAFEEYGEPLPKKPLLITMDDGYTSNLTIAGPVLEELSMHGVVFVIGINEGEERYAHSGEILGPPRFSYQEIEPWIQKGVLDAQSHTYDFHQLKSYGFSGRDGVLPLEGETAEKHREILLQDCKAFRQRREGKVSTELTAIAYPFGYHTPEIDTVLKDEFKISFTTKEHLNRVIPGDKSTLRMLGRFNVSGEMTGAELVAKLQNQKD